ncbi:tyrosine--tRNA ligase [Candidatus Bathyarchaeota archaeon RBG_13_60_20]|nr:MAG: tyrosine--tRNA ligase [Candidatus Bathyarchaeota archaeon RBG_13_60_20]
MDTDSRFNLVTRNLQEIITADELRSLLETNDHPRGYVGFEPSGIMHAGTGLLVGKKMSDFVDAGFHFIIYLAEWHGWINNKMGGVAENLAIAAEYFKDCFTALGLPEGRVEYLWASDIVDTKDYWEKVVRVMKSTTLRRTLRAMPIMGRSADTADVETAWALYPAMQASDIFQMDLDCACAGMDQRKVHMLAREVAPRLGFKVPVCLHNPLLPGLQQVGLEGSFDEDQGINESIRHKMSKSVSRGAIWVNDAPEEIRGKYHDAFCPEKVVKDNPVLDHARMAVFPNLGKLEIERPEKYGGDVTYNSFEELADAYGRGGLHPLDLKRGVAESMIKLLEPVARYFDRKPENLDRMRQLTVTR